MAYRAAAVARRAIVAELSEMLAKTAAAHAIRRNALASGVKHGTAVVKALNKS